MDIWLPIGLMVAYLIAYYVTYTRLGRSIAYAVGAAWCFGWAVWALVAGDLLGFLINLAGTAVWVWLSWRSGPRNRWKRLRRAIGDRTKALVAKMTTFVKEAGKRRPVSTPGWSPA